MKSQSLVQPPLLWLQVVHTFAYDDEQSGSRTPQPQSHPSLVPNQLNGHVQSSLEPHPRSSEPSSQSSTSLQTSPAKRHAEPSAHSVWQPPLDEATAVLTTPPHEGLKGASSLPSTQSLVPSHTQKLGMHAAPLSVVQGKSSGWQPPLLLETVLVGPELALTTLDCVPVPVEVAGPTPVLVLLPAPAPVDADLPPGPDESLPPSPPPPAPELPKRPPPPGSPQAAKATTQAPTQTECFQVKRGVGMGKPFEEMHGGVSPFNPT